MNAGCGSGRVTKILAEKITEGNIYAIDSDPNMIEKTKEVLKDFINVKVMQANLLDVQSLNISIKFDVIFSNAVLHWILDHRRVFENFYDLRIPNGQLLIQCGEYRNLQRTLSVFDNVQDLPEFSKYFSKWNLDRNYADSKETENILKEIGYKDIQVYLTEAPARFNSKKDYSIYLKTVDLRPYLKYLPTVQLQNDFVNKVLLQMEKYYPNLCWNLDYLRLSVVALT